MYICTHAHMYICTYTHTRTCTCTCNYTCLCNIEVEIYISKPKPLGSQWFSCRPTSNFLFHLWHRWYAVGNAKNQRYPRRRKHNGSSDGPWLVFSVKKLGAKFTTVINRHHHRGRSLSTVLAQLLKDHGKSLASLWCFRNSLFYNHFLLNILVVIQH